MYYEFEERVCIDASWDDHMVAVLRETFGDIKTFPFGVIRNDWGECVCVIATKEEGLLKVDTMLRLCAIDKVLHESLSEEIMRCPHLYETFTLFKMCRCVDQKNRRCAIMTTNAEYRTLVRSKMYAETLIIQAIQNGLLHPLYAHRLREIYTQCDLPESLAEVKCQRVNRSRVIIFYSDNGDPIKPPAFSRRQYQDILEAIMRGALIAGELRGVFTNHPLSKKLPKKHETDESYFIKYGKNSALFYEFVQ